MGRRSVDDTHSTRSIYDDLGVAAPVAQVHEASLIEDVAEEVPATDGEITFDLMPFEVRAYRVRLA